MKKINFDKFLGMTKDCYKRLFWKWYNVSRLQQFIEIREINWKFMDLRMAEDNEKYTNSVNDYQYHFFKCRFFEGISLKMIASRITY